MKKLLMCLMLLLSVSAAQAVQPYFKVESGVIGLGVLKGNSLGFRVGMETQQYDFQIGYTRDDGNLDTDRVISNGATISSVVLEANKKVKLPGKFSLLAGVGAGFASVDLNSRDKADAGLVTSAGAEARYTVNKNLYVGISVRGQLLYVNTTRTDYGSHTETLYIGGIPSGEVEVLDAYPRSNGLNLNSGKALITLVWKF